jgi:hypothetical protein
MRRSTGASHANVQDVQKQVDAGVRAAHFNRRSVCFGAS